MRRRDFLIGGTAAAFASASPPALAQDVYPARQIRLVVPTSPGGVHDVIGRIWAERVKSSFGTIVIENRAGGGSSIALNYVVQQPADGHLLLVGSTSTLVPRRTREVTAAASVSAVSGSRKSVAGDSGKSPVAL